MKRLIPLFSLLMLVVSTTFASAETTDAVIVATPVSHVILVDAATGRTLAEYVLIAPRKAPQLTVPDTNAQPKRAFDDVKPLTIQQEDDAAERERESHGPPLHTN